MCLARGLQQYHPVNPLLVLPAACLMALEYRWRNLQLAFDQHMCQ